MPICEEADRGDSKEKDIRELGELREEIISEVVRNIANCLKIRQSKY